MEIIPISQSVINDNETNTVNARDLHKALEVRKDFSNWMKAQINRACLEENVDYVTYAQKGEGGKFGSIEYILTIDSAKHISMMSSSVKGKAIRDYFIEAEKQLRQSTHTNLSSTMEDLILRQNALLSEVVQELRVTQQAVIDAKDETIQVQRETINALSSVAPQQVTINQTTVKAKSYSLRMIDSGAEELFVNAVRMLLKDKTELIPQGEILARLGKNKADKTALRWLHKYIGVYWDMVPVGVFNYYSTTNELGGVA